MIAFYELRDCPCPGPLKGTCPDCPYRETATTTPLIVNVIGGKPWPTSNPVDTKVKQARRD